MPETHDSAPARECDGANRRLGFFQRARWRKFPDIEGTELSGLDEARGQAIVAAGEAIKRRDRVCAELLSPKRPIATLLLTHDRGDASKSGIVPLEMTIGCLASCL